VHPREYRNYERSGALLRTCSASPLMLGVCDSLFCIRSESERKENTVLSSIQRCSVSLKRMSSYSTSAFRLLPVSFRSRCTESAGLHGDRPRSAPPPRTFSPPFMSLMTLHQRSSGVIVPSAQFVNDAVYDRVFDPEVVQKPLLGPFCRGIWPPSKRPLVS
jgi:hypothetical protein